MFEVFQRFGLRRTLSIFNGVTHSVKGVRYSLFQGFSSMNESPELPYWFKSQQDDECSSLGSEDDFVLPKIINWVGHQKFDGQNVNIKRVPLGTIDNDVNKITIILKGRFSSPDAVVQALGGCNVGVFKDLVDKLLKRFSNDWISAFGFFKWAHMQTGCSHSADTYDLMVDILGKSKQFDLMLDLVEKMAHFGGLISLATITKIMRRFAKAGRWEDAIKTFRGIEQFGLRKDTSSMNLLLDALCKERSVEHAQAAFLEFKNEIPPDSHTFNVLIHGWCRARKMDKAWWIMEEMKSYGFQPCVVSYTSLIEAYCWEKDFRKVYAILDEMQAKGCSPNVMTYTIVMHSHGKSKETRKAVEIHERMKRNGCIPDTSFYNSLIHILSKAGRFQDAHAVYEEISKSGNTPNVTTYNTMISAACEYSQEEMALKLLQEMEKNLCKPDLKTYAPLLKMCCRKKWMKVLSYLLDDMFEKDVSIDFGTHTLLVRCLCQSGKLEHACYFFEEMVFRGLVPMDCTYSTLVEELERKKMEDAKERIQQLMAQAKIMK